MKQTRALALCGVTAALAVAVMAAGGVLGIGTYISPLIAGMCLLPVGSLLGEKIPHHALAGRVRAELSARSGY